LSLAACANCEGLFNAPDEHAPGAPRVCPRCLTVAELLQAADALNNKVKAELDRPSRHVVVIGRRDVLVPLVARATSAIEKARGL